MGAEGRELGWDDQIEDDGKDFEPLPEGDYSFTIEKVERGRSKGENKLPPCNMAIVTFIVHGSDRDIEIRENYVLHTNLERKLSEFFCGVGLKEKGKKVPMRWGQVPGRTGRAHITIEPGYNDPNKKFNKVKKIYPKDESPKYTAGSF